MANSYASSADLMDRLGMELNDPREGILIDTLDAASRWVDRVVGHRFYTNTETRYYNLPCSYLGGYMGASFPIDDVLSVSSITADLNGDGVYETTWTPVTDYWLSPRNALANGRPYTQVNKTYYSTVWDVLWSYPFAQATIAVTGSFGYSTLATRPPEIRELTLMVAAEMAGAGFASPLGMAGAGGGDLSIPGVQQYSIGQDLSVSMQKPADLLQSNLPPAGKRIIEMFRRTAVMA